METAPSNGALEFGEYDAPRLTTVSEASNSGIRWELDDDAFERWWRALPTEDRDEFVGVYGGDMTLARFVCAFDYLTIMKAQPQTGQVIVTAYYIAARLPLHDADGKIRAAKAWRHDAVQAMIDRLRYRASRQAATRIQNASTYLIEKMLHNSTNLEPEPIMNKEGEVVGHKSVIPDQALVAKAAMTYLKLVQTEDVQDRAERTKRGFEAARSALANAEQADLEVPTPSQAALYLGILKDQIGPEKFAELTREALNEAP